MEIERIAWYRVHYSEIERYLKEAYEWDVDFCKAMGVNSGNSADFDVTPIKHARPKRAKQLLDRLCADKALPAGRITVTTHKHRRAPQRQIDEQTAAEIRAADIRRAVIAATI